MNNIDTLIKAKWIIPIEPDNHYYDDYAIAIHQGMIVDVLPQSKADQQYKADEIIDLSQHAVLPGFVNTHTHSPMTLFRGMADDLELMDWLTNHIWPAEKKWMNPEFIKAGTKLAIAEMIKSGTTCFNEHYLFPTEISEIIDYAKVRANVGIFAIDFPTPQAQTLDEYLQQGIALFDTYNNHPLIHICAAPHAPYTMSDKALSKIKQIADQHDTQIHIHMHETKHEIQESMKQYNMRPLKRMHQLGLMNSRFLCVHMTQVNDDDINLLQQTNSHVIHCPESNLKLASGFCPVQTLLEANINVALGTDGAVSNNDLDMLSELRTAALVQKAVDENPTATSAATSLRIATLNGAKAMGLDKLIGSIEKGKAADLIAIDLNKLNTQPVYNPISQIVYAAHASQITDVWVAGKRLLENQKLTTLDETAIISEAIDWKNKIQK